MQVSVLLVSERTLGDRPGERVSGQSAVSGG